MGRDPKDGEPPAGLSYAMCLKAAIPGEPLARQSLAEFDRKPISEVISAANWQPVLEAVRLAPSATNSQPWFFAAEGDVLCAYCRQLGFLKAKILGRMNQIDMGIGLCHLVLSLEHAGKSVAGWNFQPRQAPAGYYSVASIQMTA
jgi:hypothetical protein